MSLFDILNENTGLGGDMEILEEYQNEEGLYKALYEDALDEILIFKEYGLPIIMMEDSDDKSIGEKLIEVIKKIVESVIDFIKKVWNVITGIIKGFVNWVKKFFGGFKKAKDIVEEKAKKGESVKVPSDVKKDLVKASKEDKDFKNAINGVNALITSYISGKDDKSLSDMGNVMNNVQAYEEFINKQEKNIDHKKTKEEATVDDILVADVMMSEKGSKNIHDAIISHANIVKKSGEVTKKRISNLESQLASIDKEKVEEIKEIKSKIMKEREAHRKINEVARILIGHGKNTVMRATAAANKIK